MRSTELPRYIVGIPAGRICYQGESKITAWLTWTLHRKSGALAFDCASWVSKPSDWLAGGAPADGLFEVPPAISVRNLRRLSSENSEGRLISRYVKHSRSLLSDEGKYKQWKWSQMVAPAHKQEGLRWALRRFKLRRFINSGGVLVIIGRARSGKTFLLERLMPSCIIENVRKNGFQINAHIELSEIPSGIFAIDETQYHAHDDVMRVLDHTLITGQGLALVFQIPEMFRNYEIANSLANRKVLFLEFS